QVSRPFFSRRTSTISLAYPQTNLQERKKITSHSAAPGWGACGCEDALHEALHAPPLRGDSAPNPELKPGSRLPGSEMPGSGLPGSELPGSGLPGSCRTVDENQGGLFEKSAAASCDDHRPRDTLP